MRPTLCLMAIGVFACRQAAPPPAAELRPLVVKDLPGALASIAGQPSTGAWRCVERGALLACKGGAEDVLTVSIDSIEVDAAGLHADVVLTATGGSAAHFGPNSAAGFIVQWRDSYERAGGAWKRTARDVLMIT